MRVYFDTNIYSYVCSTGESTQVARILKRHNCVLVASAGNLFEMYAIRSNQRDREIQTLADLADEFERYPESYLHARELRFEIKRLRPKCIHSVPFTRTVRQFLSAHKEHWQRATAGVNPSPADYTDYTRDHEGGIAQKRMTQKGLRTAAGSGSDFVLTDFSGTTIPVDTVGPGDDGERRSCGAQTPPCVNLDYCINNLRQV